MPDIPLSNRYRHDVMILYRDFAEQRITEEELSQRLDELRAREVAAQGPLGQYLLLEKLAEEEKAIASDVQRELQRNKRRQELDEQKQEMERWKKEQDEIQQTIRKVNNRISFRTDVDTYLKRLEENARTLQIWYTWIQLVLLVSSAVTAAMASVDIVPRWMVSISGVIAAIAGGAITTFKIQDRIYANRKAVAEIQLECQKYDYRIEEYDSNEEQRFIKFSRNISLIRGEQMLQEVEFWKPQKEDREEEKAVLPSSQKGKEKETEEVAKKALQEEGPADSEK